MPEKNSFIRHIQQQYIEDGLCERDATLETIETYKQIRAEIRTGADAKTILMDYGFGDEFWGVYYES